MDIKIKKNPAIKKNLRLKKPQIDLNNKDNQFANIPSFTTEISDVSAIELCSSNLVTTVGKIEIEKN